MTLNVTSCPGKKAKNVFVVFSVNLADSGQICYSVLNKCGTNRPDVFFVLPE